MAKNIPLTEFDLITVNPLVQVAKALIPFLDLQTQKTFSFMIRFYEFQQTIQFFDKISNQNPFECGSTHSPHVPIRSFNDILSNEEILNTVVKHCPENYASMINSYKQFSKMSQMMDIFNTSNINPSGSPDSFDISSLMNLMNNLNSEPKSTSRSDKSTADMHSSDTHTSNTVSSMQSFMNTEQKNLYQQYMKELDNLDFNNITPNERN